MNGASLGRMDRKGLLDKVIFYWNLNSKELAFLARLRSGGRTFQVEGSASSEVAESLFSSRKRRMELFKQGLNLERSHRPASGVWCSQFRLSKDVWVHVNLWLKYCANRLVSVDPWIIFTILMTFRVEWEWKLYLNIVKWIKNQSES